MQLRLLNFYKILSQFAVHLICAFIPIMIYQATGNLAYGFLACAGEYLLRIILDISCKKLFFRYPQIFLLLRLLPIILCSVFLIIINYNFIVGTIGVIIFNALAWGLRNVPQEVVYNYSSVGKNSGSIGLTRLFENLGTILGIVLGGVLLDNLSTLVVILLSSGMYLVSVIPLLIFYIRGRKQSTFNKETVSNATLFYKDAGLKKSSLQRNITKKLLLRYGIVYFVFCVVDFLPIIMSINIFLNFQGVFFLSGLASGLFWGLFGMASLIYGKLDEKYDTTLLFVGCALSMAGLIIGLAFVKNMILMLYMIAAIGTLYSVVSGFCLARMLPRARIMGVSNDALVVRNLATMLAVAMIAILCAVASMHVGIIVIGLMFIVSAIITPINEERTRAMLVDYINDNDILDDENPMFKDKMRRRRLESKAQSKLNKWLR